MAANTVLKTGRRKTAVARVALKKGSGKLIINNQEADAYITGELLRLKVREPLVLAGVEGKYDIKANVFGGGQNSQVEAVRQGIARALIEIMGSDELKKKFLSYDRSMIVSDTRFKEMRKPNTSKARAKRQKSYR